MLPSLESVLSEVEGGREGWGGVSLSCWREGWELYEMRGRWRSLLMQFTSVAGSCSGAGCWDDLLWGFLLCQCYDWIKECIHLAWPLNPRLCTLVCIRSEKYWGSWWSDFWIESNIFGCRKTMQFQIILVVWLTILLDFMWENVSNSQNVEKQPTYHILVLALKRSRFLFV